MRNLDIHSIFELGYDLFLQTWIAKLTLCISSGKDRSMNLSNSVIAIAGMGRREEMRSRVANENFYRINGYHSTINKFQSHDHCYGFIRAS